MAEFRLEVDEETGVTYLEIIGILSNDEQVAFMKSKSYSERTMRLVCDMRNASLEELPRGVLVKMVRAVKPLGKPGIRAAYVFRKGEDSSKGKMLLAQLEALGFEGTFKVFTDFEKAQSWVLK